MAWIKELEHNETGAIASYWEVMSVHYDHRAQTSILVAGGWVSKVAYDGAKEPLLTKRWEIPAGLAPQLAAGAVSFVSGFAKAQPEFEGWQEAV